MNVKQRGWTEQFWLRYNVSFEEYIKTNYQLPRYVWKGKIPINNKFRRRNKERTFLATFHTIRKKFTAYSKFRRVHSPRTKELGTWTCLKDSIDIRVENVPLLT